MFGLSKKEKYRKAIRDELCTMAAYRLVDESLAAPGMNKFVDMHFDSNTAVVDAAVEICVVFMESACNVIRSGESSSLAPMWIILESRFRREVAERLERGTIATLTASHAIQRLDNALGTPSEEQKNVYHNMRLVERTVGLRR